MRVAAGLILPGAVLLANGRPELMVYAVFGSFTGMYGRAEAHRVRLRHQLQAGGLLVMGVAGGVAFGGSGVGPEGLVATVTCFAFVATILTHRWGLVPQGPFFGIFALGAVATIPSGNASPPTAVLIAGGTALLCVAIGFAGRRSPPSPDDAPEHRPILCAHESWTRCLTLHAARYAVAIAVAGTCGVVLGVNHANWAMAAAAVPLAAAHLGNSLHPTPRRVLERSLHRVGGTLGGLALTALVLLAHPSPVWLGVVVVAFLFPTELFMSHHYGLALGFFTPLILGMTQLAAPSAPLTLLTDRVVDTVLGVAVGATVAVLLQGQATRPMDPNGRRRRRLSAVGRRRLRTTPVTRPRGRVTGVAGDRFFSNRGRGLPHWQPIKVRPGTLWSPSHIAAMNPPQELDVCINFQHARLRYFIRLQIRQACENQTGRGQRQSEAPIGP